MAFDQHNRGDPFHKVRPGGPADSPPDYVRAAVRRQVIELTQRPYKPAVRHTLLRSLQRRRQRWPSVLDASLERLPFGFTDHTVTQFDFLPVNVGADTLLVRGELLITKQSYDGQYAPVAGNRCAKSYLDALGVEAHEVDAPELRDRVLRLTHDDMGPRELADVAKVLRTQGFSASLTYVTPTAGVQKSPPAPAPPSPSPPSGSAPRMAAFSAPVSGGKPAKVAIIDTGITAEVRTDGLLANVPRARRYIDPLDVFPYRGLRKGDGYLDFDAGHGTFVAGLVEHVAPEADITVYRAIDSDGIASEVRVAREMIRAVKDGAQIINLSLGCQTQDDAPPVAMQAALDFIGEHERKHRTEVLIVAAAGNNGNTAPFWPAAFRGVVSVAGLAPDMLPAQWSSRGFWVTFSTIGEGLRSTFVQGKASPLVHPEPQSFDTDAFAYWSGTSFTAPQITGALAWLYQHEGLSLREALRTLRAAGRPIPGFGQALKVLTGT